MRILVLGSGGREHALAWKLSQEAEVHAAPGNAGIALDRIECHELRKPDLSDLSELVELAAKLKPDLTLVGPESPLVAGLADLLRERGIDTFGPGKDGAQIEGSKAFAKELMKEAGVPTADFETFTEPDSAMTYAASRLMLGHGVAVKASGSALGKGVAVCATRAEAQDAIARMMIEREFGDAGSTLVVEDRLHGREFSLLTLCSGDDIFSLPAAQDYKRAFDADQGPNTGGMGSYSPVPWITDELVRRTEDEVVRPALATLKRRGIAYHGVLFSGLMLQDGRPYCLEYNARFGDPETQSIVMRVGGGFADALLACARGEKIPPVELLDNAAVTVVVASGGYPGAYRKGAPMEIGSLPDGAKLFHAGTSMSEGKLTTAGGRVLGVTAVASTLHEAREIAYHVVPAVRFDGAFSRRDIAAMA